MVKELLLKVEILFWHGANTVRLEKLSTAQKLYGKTLAPLDFLTATHALTLNTILVTNNSAFM